MLSGLMQRIQSGALAVVLLAAAVHAQSGAGTQGDSAAQLAALRAEIETLRRAMPGHAHVMTELDYRYANLWFAAQNHNWPLAEFYLNETRSNLNWMIRIRPTRRLASGQDLDISPVVKSVEDGGLASLRTAIVKQDSKAFAAAYRQALEQCYACHKLIEKPYLRPRIPEAPASRMIYMQPGAAPLH